MSNVTLTKLEKDDINQFVLDNQESFNYGALEEFGLRDNNFEEDGEIISRKTIIDCINHGVAYRIRLDGNIVGGIVVCINNKTLHNSLELLFVSPKYHSLGIGYKAWKELEKLYPNTKVWETCTPYFEKRNIHFYVNKLGFHIVEFFNKYHNDPNEVDGNNSDDCMFRFEKYY